MPLAIHDPASRDINKCEEGCANKAAKTICEDATCLRYQRLWRSSFLDAKKRFICLPLIAGLYLVGQAAPLQETPTIRLEQPHSGTSAFAAAPWTSLVACMRY
eukprot:1305895-Amphidinium_carterae.6